MNVTKEDIKDIPDVAFKSISSLRQALHVKWSGIGFSEETLKRMIEDRNKTSVSTILEQLQNIRASLSLRHPVVQVCKDQGIVRTWKGYPHEWLPYVTINDTDQLLEALVEELSK